jgi:hypothetical protein
MKAMKKLATGMVYALDQRLVDSGGFVVIELDANGKEVVSTPPAPAQQEVKIVRRRVSKQESQTARG